MIYDLKTPIKPHYINQTKIVNGEIIRKKILKTHSIIDQPIIEWYKPTIVEYDFEMFIALTTFFVCLMLLSLGYIIGYRHAFLKNQKMMIENNSNSSYENVIADK